LINLVIGVTVFSIVFLPSILLTRTINTGDIENLRQMTVSLGLVNRFLNPMFNFVEKLLMLIMGYGKEPQGSIESKEPPL